MFGGDDAVTVQELIVLLCPTSEESTTSDQQHFYMQLRSRSELMTTKTRSEKKLRSKKVLRKRIETNSLETASYAEYWKVSDILKMNGKLKKPPYQRKIIWDSHIDKDKTRKNNKKTELIVKTAKNQMKMKPELIKAILERQIISSCMVQETPSGSYIMLNCQQRFEAIRSFFQNKYAIPKKVDEERAGLKFKDLQEQEKKNFLNHELLMQVQVSSNGKGNIAYRGAQIGMGHSKEEIFRSDYHKNPFFRHIQAQLRKPLLSKFFNDSGILTRGKIARCEDEDLMGEVLLLEASGACEGKEYKEKLEDFRKPTMFNRFRNGRYEEKLAKHIRIVNKIFPEGVEYHTTHKVGSDKKIKPFIEKTRLGNKTAFYRLIGAIKMIEEIEGGHDIFTDAKCSRIREKLPKFATKAGADGRAGIAEGDYQRYYASTTRATTNKKIRQIGIDIIKDQIMKC